MMSHFTAPIRIEETDREVNGRVVYRTLDPICFVLGDTEDVNVTLIVPHQYEFDGASVPRVLWPVFEPMGRHARAAALHDYLYCGGVSRWIADAVFREALVATGESLWKARAAWAIVRLFGGPYYRQVNRMEPIVNGRKTYLVCLVSIVYAVAGFYMKTLDLNQMIQMILAALGAAGLRDGVAKSAKPAA